MSVQDTYTDEEVKLRDKIASAIYKIEYKPGKWETEQNLVAAKAYERADDFIHARRATVKSVKEKLHDKLNRPLDSISWSGQVQATLDTEDSINCLGDLVSKSITELRGFLYNGVVIAQIHQNLAREDLSLGMDTYGWEPPTPETSQ